MSLILTPRVPLTLQETCRARTGALLRDGYYQQDLGTRNHFEFLPRGIVDELFQVVIRAQVGKHTSRVDRLHPLLTSGRITELDIPRGSLEAEDFFRVVDAIQCASGVRSLRVIPLSFSLQNTIRLRDILFNWKVKVFVSKCTNVEYLRIPGEAFDTQILLRHSKLKTLKVEFVRSLKLEASQIGDKFIHHNLTEVSIGACDNLHESMAKILECCPNLVTVDNDIAGALELLHAKQLYDGELCARYKLRRYLLSFLELNVALRIASVTCPMTTHLYLDFWSDIILDMQSLANFVNVESLRFGGYDEPDLTDFNAGLGDALKSFGANIKCLYLLSVKIDFEAIGTCCPNLTVFKVCFCHSYDIQNSSAEYFGRMEELCLECSDDNRNVETEVQFLLSGCKELHTLQLLTVEWLTDQLLDRLLRKNSLPCLKYIEISDCLLTQEGIHRLLESCRCLERIDFPPQYLPYNKEVERGIKSFYPDARPPCPDPVVEMLNSFPITERNASCFSGTPRSLPR